MRYFMQLSYHGADFHGWQVQPDQVTVQGTINDALSVILREPIHVLGCGRTDTGVHARYFIAHFDTDAQFDCDKLVYKLNRFIRLRIGIQKIWRVGEDVNARFDADSRLYKYYIHKQKDPFCDDLSYMYTLPLDVKKMNEAAQRLFDYTDFTSFSKLHTDVKTNDCTILSAFWEESENQLVFTISANRFLRNMVRAVVGTLLSVGMGKLTVDEFCKIIESKDRGLAGASAPAHGLFLEDVTYPSGII